MATFGGHASRAKIHMLLGLIVWLQKLGGAHLVQRKGVQAAEGGDLAANHILPHFNCCHFDLVV